MGVPIPGIPLLTQTHIPANVYTGRPPVFESLPLHGRPVEFPVPILDLAQSWLLGTFRKVNGMKDHSLIILLFLFFCVSNKIKMFKKFIFCFQWLNDLVFRTCILTIKSDGTLWQNFSNGSKEMYYCSYIRMKCEKHLNILNMLQRMIVHVSWSF